MGLVLAIGLLVALVPMGGVGQETLEAPEVTATSVFAFDPDTGEVIISKNADERLPIGSVTKVATALVVMDHLDFDDEIVVTSEDMLPDGFSSMSLQPGDTLTVEQLLIGMIVESGGDAALALARTIGGELSGSDDLATVHVAFVEEMNAKAAELGLEDTQFANPDGDDSSQAWSTARDVAYLYAAFEEDPQLAEISEMTEYSLTSVGPEGTAYDGVSTNQLAGQHNVISAKTGSTTDAGGCVVLARSSATGDGRQIVAILGADLEYDETWTPTLDERWADAVTVMDEIDANWTPGQFLQADQPTEETNVTGFVKETEKEAPATEQAPVDEGVPADDGESAAEEAPANDGEDVGDEAGSESQPAGSGQVQLAQEGDDGTTSKPSTGPIVVATVAGGVLAMAAAYSWVRAGTVRR
jgi:D-alanyl-D-alanine carboxypeptidase